MSTPTQPRVRNDDDDIDCPDQDSESLWPVVLATTGALLLGYFLGRTAYSRDLQDALDRAEHSPEPIEVSIRTL